MIGKPITGRSFGGCVRYLINREEATILLADGVRTQSANTITRDFNLQRKLNPDLGKAVGHTILSWSKNDAKKINGDKMVEIAKAYMKKMGITDTQYLIVKHTDRQHPHIHIVYNRVDNNGNTITDNNNYNRNVKACRELTEQYNLYLAQGKEQVNRQQLKGKDKVRYAIYDQVKTALKLADNWKMLEENLKRSGIEILYKYRSGTTELQGISFKKDGLVFKASAVDRAFSFARINEKLIANHKQNELKSPLENQAVYNQTGKRIEKSAGGTDRDNGAIKETGTSKIIDILFSDEYLENEFNPFEQVLKRKKKKKKRSLKL